MTNLNFLGIAFIEPASGGQPPARGLDHITTPTLLTGTSSQTIADIPYYASCIYKENREDFKTCLYIIRGIQKRIALMYCFHEDILYPQTVNKEKTCVNQIQNDLETCTHFIKMATDMLKIAGEYRAEKTPPDDTENNDQAMLQREVENLDILINTLVVDTSEARDLILSSEYTPSTAGRMFATFTDAISYKIVLLIDSMISQQIVATRITGLLQESKEDAKNQAQEDPAVVSRLIRVHPQMSDIIRSFGKLLINAHENLMAPFTNNQIRPQQPIHDHPVMPTSI